MDEVKAGRCKSKFYVTPAKSLAATAVMVGVEKQYEKRKKIRIHGCQSPTFHANIISYVNYHQESITEKIRSIRIHNCVAYLGDVSLGNTRSPSLAQTVLIYGKCP